MLERVLLDANTLLNATFIPQSWSRLVISRLVQQRKCLFVGSRTFLEAQEVARKIAAELRKSSDPTIALEGFVRQAGAIEVPPTSEFVEAQIPSHDQHVVREAIAANATIFTSDGELWAACKEVGRNAILPLQALRFLDGLSIATTIYGVTPGTQFGSIYARVFPGGWADMRGIGQFTVIHFADRFWLYYCTERRAWVVEVQGARTIALPAEIQSNQLQIVAVSWQAGQRMMLRVASIETPGDVPMRHPFSRGFDVSCSVGHRTNGDKHWNGAINVCVMNDRQISSRLWSSLRKYAELTPNPFDSDRLRQGIHQIVA